MATLTMTVNLPDVDTSDDARSLAGRIILSWGARAVLVAARWDDEDDPGPEEGFSDEGKDEDPARPDREVEAIAQCVRALVFLDPEQARAVASYVADRFIPGRLEARP